MASSTDASSGKAKPDPREEANRALQQALMGGLAKANTIDASSRVAQQKAALGYQQLLDRQALDRQMAAADMHSVEQDADLKRQQHLIGLDGQGSKIKLSLQAEMAKRQAEAKAAQAKQPSAMDVVNATLAGTETKTFRPQAPMSTGPADVAGADAMAVLQQALAGGRDVQMNGPLAQQGGPAGVAGGAPPQAGPQQGGPPMGGGGPPSVQVGGQTFQAPPEITQRTNEVGVNPVRMSGGTYNMPTFQSRTTTTPNVLTAAQAATLNQNQQQQILENSWKMYQDSDGAPLDKLVAANTQLAKTGDTGGLMAMVDQYPSLARSAAKADIDYRKALRATTLEQANYYAAQAGLVGDQRAFMKLQNLGVDKATGWGSYLGIGEGQAAGSWGTTASGKPTFKQGAGALGKLNVSEIFNEKEGTFDTLNWVEYQKHILRNEGRLVYQDPQGGVLGVGGKPGNINTISLPDLANAFLVAQSGNANPEQRAAAIKALDGLPFVTVSPSKDGGVIIRPEGDDSSAAQFAGTLASNLKMSLEAGVPIPPFVVDPGVAAAMAAEKKAAAQQAATPTPTPAAAPPSKPGYPLRSTLKGAVGKAAGQFSQLPAEVQRIIGEWRPGLKVPPGLVEFLTSGPAFRPGTAKRPQPNPKYIGNPK